ncbi:MAG TPA: hypothetical protein P5268_02790 [Candidatus Marinimicrobia bacterium]|nr:hypothetical protein [Candidatus Neomarinimicrobiota bacterium]
MRGNLPTLYCGGHYLCWQRFHTQSSVPDEPITLQLPDMLEKQQIL